MRIVTSGIGLRAGHVLTTLKEEMPEETETNKINNVINFFILKY